MPIAIPVLYDQGFSELKFEALQNYQVILYQYLGVTNKMALVMVGVWGTIGTIFCCIGAVLFDKLGRRVSLLSSLWVQFLASIAMVICKSFSFHGR